MPYVKIAVLIKAFLQSILDLWIELETWASDVIEKMCKRASRYILTELVLRQMPVEHPLGGYIIHLLPYITRNKKNGCIHLGDFFSLFED